MFDSSKSTKKNVKENDFLMLDFVVHITENIWTISVYNKYINKMK